MRRTREDGHKRAGDGKRADARGWTQEGGRKRVDAREGRRSCPSIVNKSPHRLQKEKDKGIKAKRNRCLFNISEEKHMCLNC